MNSFKIKIIVMFYLFVFLLLGCSKNILVKPNFAKNVESHIIAVLDIDNYTNYYNLSNIARDELTQKLSYSGLYRIVDRNKLVNIIEEQKLQMTGHIDPATVVEIGKLSGASLIITGSIQQVEWKRKYFSESSIYATVYMNFKLISIETGEYILNVNRIASKDRSDEQDLPAITRKCVRSFLNDFMLTHYEKKNTIIGEIVYIGSALLVLLLGLKIVGV